MKALLTLLTILLITTPAYAVVLTIPVPDQAASDLVDYLSQEEANPPSTGAEKKAWLENNIKEAYLKEEYKLMKVKQGRSSVDSTAVANTTTAFGG